MLPTATSGWLAKVVPDTGFSCEKSPKNNQYAQSTDWSLSTVCSPFPAVTLPSYLADQDVHDSHELRGNPTDPADENPTQTLPLRRQLMRILGESSAVCLTHRDARPVVQSTAAYLGGHRVWKARQTNCTPWVQPALAPPKQIN